MPQMHTIYLHDAWALSYSPELLQVSSVPCNTRRERRGTLVGMPRTSGECLKWGILLKPTRGSACIVGQLLDEGKCQILRCINAHTIYLHSTSHLAPKTLYVSKSEMLVLPGEIYLYRTLLSLSNFVLWCYPSLIVKEVSIAFDRTLELLLEWHANHLHVTQPCFAATMYFNSRSCSHTCYTATWHATGTLQCCGTQHAWYNHIEHAGYPTFTTAKT